MLDEGVPPEGPLAAGTPIADVDLQGILALIPHRYPFLLIDRVTGMEAFRCAVGLKNVTMGEPYFQGHFPGHPIMPGVLIIEAMAQAASVLAVASLGRAARGNPVYFMTVENARFRKPVLPGDQLRLEIDVLRNRLGVWKFAGRALVESTLAAEAEFGAKLVTR